MHHVSFHARDLLVGHGTIGGAEIDRPLDELAYAAAGADRLVVDSDARLFRVNIEPFGVEWGREGCAGSGQGRPSTLSATG